jgi:hypothetical protein
MAQNQMNEDLARALLAELKATMLDKKSGQNLVLIT